jgi:hypothetical protein
MMAAGPSTTKSTCKSRDSEYNQAKGGGRGVLQNRERPDPGRYETH